MSKIGQKPVIIEDGIQIVINGQVIKVTGKEGNLEINVPPMLNLVQEDKQLLVTRKNDNKVSKANHGLYRSLIQNAVSGVNKVWEKRLEIVGTGFRVKPLGAGISLEIGFSHPVVFQPTEGIKFAIEGTNKIIVSGIDKQLVGQVAYQIKSARKPDPYKGKGLRYEGEVIKLKAGKKAKTAGAK